MKHRNSLEETALEIHVRVPPELSGEEIKRLMGQITLSGGEIVDLEVVSSEEPMQEQQQAIALQAKPELHERIGKTYPIVEKEDFYDFALGHELSLAWSTRLWRDCTGFYPVTSYGIPILKNGKQYNSAGEVEPKSLDMSELRDRIRAVEQGVRSMGVFRSLGNRTWDVVVSLNNRFAAKTEELILPWDEEIHPKLNNRTGSLSRQTAQEKLSARYQDLRSERMLFEDMSTGNY